MHAKAIEDSPCDPSNDPRFLICRIRFPFFAGERSTQLLLCVSWDLYIVERLFGHAS